MIGAALNQDVSWVHAGMARMTGIVLRVGK
jgi:hypothetical protein